MNDCVTCGKPATHPLNDDVWFCEPITDKNECFQTWFRPIMWDVLGTVHNKKETERVLSTLSKKGTAS